VINNLEWTLKDLDWLDAWAGREPSLGNCGFHLFRFIAACNLRRTGGSGGNVPERRVEDAVNASGENKILAFPAFLPLHQRSRVIDAFRS